MEKTRPDISHLKEQIDNSSPFIPCQPICTAGKILSGERVPGETGENPLLEESITLLFAPEIPTRIAAASALGILGDQQAIEPLFRTCMDDHAAVRDAAREALARIGVRYRQRTQKRRDLSENSFCTGDVPASLNQ